MSKAENKIVCALCGAPAQWDEKYEVYRHASTLNGSTVTPWEDGSALCDKYGYPIPVRKEERDE